LRLGYGELEPEGAELSTRKARIIFLEALNRLVPETLEILKKEVFPYYCPLPSKWSGHLRWWHLKQAGCVIGGKQRYPELVDIKKALIYWSDHFHLNTEWILNDALNTLFYWTILPNANLEWLPKGSTYWDSRLEPFSVGAWKPIEESERQFRDRVKAELDKYIIAAKEMDDLISVPDKNQMDHFEWLVYYQVQNWSHSKIANTYYVTRKNVSQRLDEISKLCEIPLRPYGKPGRPRS